MKIFRIATALACIALFPTLASAASGEKLYKKKCKMCHSLEAGNVKGGPSLAGIMGTPAGKQASFKKYKGLAGADFLWTDANMDAWLTNPKKFVGKKSTMFVKVKKAKDRAAIIEFLKTR